MIETLPPDASTILDWGWDRFEPYYAELLTTDLSRDNLHEFLGRWSRVHDLVTETEHRLTVARTANTADEEADARFKRYLDEVYSRVQQEEQKLKEKLVATGLEPHGLEVGLKKVRAQIELYRNENVPLLADDQKLALEYQEVVGGQTIEWEGRELPLPMVAPIYQDTDRSVREEAWRRASRRQLADKSRLDELWQKMLDVRLKMAKNAGFSDYRQFRWRQLLRFDYTPDHNLRFHKAVKEVVVPAYQRILKHRRESLGLPALRPWDLRVDPQDRQALKPFQDADDFTRGTSRIFNNVAPQLGHHFDTMVERYLLDLESRKNKGPGGYCTSFPAAHEPFIFMNAAGTNMDVQTLLHEGGHAFHVFESAHLPYYQQREVPIEFAEVASMSMELLAAPYLDSDEGGFYTTADAARARIEALERMIQVWISVTQTDEFQHWVYTQVSEPADGAHCDREWSELYREYVPSEIDWSGLEPDLADGWRRILHIFVVPFYVIEYAIAQLAAVQLWAQAREDQAAAVKRYRTALSLGGTKSLPHLYAAVGAKFDFGEETLGPAVELIESTLAELRPIAEAG